MKAISLILLALCACQSAPPEPASHRVAAVAHHRAAGSIRFDEHGACVMQEDGMERCTKFGVAVVQPPHHSEDRP